MNEYIWHYNGNSGSVFAEDSYSAKLLAVKVTKAPKSKQHMISVLLHKKDGEIYKHSTASV